MVKIEASKRKGGINIGKLNLRAQNDAKNAQLEIF